MQRTLLSILEESWWFIDPEVTGRWTGFRRTLNKSFGVSEIGVVMNELAFLDGPRGLELGVFEAALPAQGWDHFRTT